MLSPGVVRPSSPALATAADLAELERCEILGGVIHEKASPSGVHGNAQLEFGILIRGPFHSKGRGGGPGGWWIMSEVEIELGPHEVFVPDIVGWRIERVPEQPMGRPVRIAPDWVCEILSPSTAHRDLGHKQRVYHQRRVGHSWIVDPQNQALTVYRWHQDGYVAVLSAGPRERVRAEPFDAIEIYVGQLFGIEPEETPEPAASL